MFTKDHPNKSAITPPNAVSFKAPEAKFDNVTGVPSAQSFNDPTATVEYKTRALYQKGSPMLDAVRTKVKQMGESRGLLSSMSNIGAGESAVLNTAAQIVSPDSAAEQNRINANQAQVYGIGNALMQGRTQGALAQQAQGFQAGMARYNNEFQDYLADKGYDQQKIRQFGNAYNTLVDSMVNAMGRIISTKGQTWDQAKQDAFDQTINASKGWLASLFDLKLS